MRCFVALDLPAPVRNHLADVIAPLRERFDVKWVAKDQLHLTLVFAGELPDDLVAPLADMVRHVELPPLSLSLSALGCFPPRGMPRVVWAGLSGDAEALGALHADLSAAAETLGVPRERRDFVPHVTLGRVKSQFGALALIDELKKGTERLKPKPFAPTALVLYRSELRRAGPVHEPLVHRAVPAPPPQSPPRDPIDPAPDARSPD